MAELFGVEVDVADVLKAFDQAGPVMERHLKGAAKVTADHIAREAQARLQRQLGPGATGKTVAGIRVVEDERGYLVIAQRNPFPNLPLWLDKGTVRMSARPFFDSSAQLEQGPHLRRLHEAAQAAIAEVGLGE